MLDRILRLKHMCALIKYVQHKVEIRSDYGDTHFDYIDT